MFGRHGFKFGRGGGHGFKGEFMRMRRGDIKFHLLEILKDTPGTATRSSASSKNKAAATGRVRVRFTRRCKCSKKRAI